MMRILPYRTTEDRIDGVVITFSDVTESKVAKVELERTQLKLEEKVAERTKDLQMANESLLSEVAERRRSEVVRVKLLNQLVNAQEAERSRLARDLHDQLGQQLTALRLKLESIKAQANKRSTSDIEQLLSITGQLDSDVEFLAWQLRPVVLDDLGLVEALRLYVARWAEHVNITSEFHSAGFDTTKRLAPEVENNLYRIAQEALNNVAKHSHASNVDVLLEQRDGHLVLIVEDNGVGFVHDDRPDESRLGLIGVRQRASLLGGTVEIESTPGKGATLFVRTPLKDGKA